MKVPHSLFSFACTSDKKNCGRLGGQETVRRERESAKKIGNDKLTGEMTRVLFEKKKKILFSPYLQTWRGCKRIEQVTTQKDQCSALYTEWKHMCVCLRHVSMHTNNTTHKEHTNTHANNQTV